jgi:hypothetical protein
MAGRIRFHVGNSLALIQKKALGDMRTIGGKATQKCAFRFVLGLGRNGETSQKV